MNVSFFIAKNLFFSKNNNQRVSKLAVGIATMGVAVGLAIMILSVCVVRGFKNETSANTLPRQAVWYVCGMVIPYITLRTQ